MKYDIEKIKALCDGKLSSTQIGEIVSCPAKYVQRVMLKYDLPRLKSGPPRGERNPFWKGGRVIDRDGYVSVPAPQNHPRAKNSGRILEHRLMMEQKIGRFLEPEEVVHHKNTCHLDNRIENLQLMTRKTHFGHHVVRGGKH